MGGRRVGDADRHGGAILGPVVNQIQSGLGVPQSQAGLIITTHGLFIVLTSPIAGAIIDRMGPRRPYVAGLFVYGVAGAAGLVVESFPLLLASRAVLGVGVAFVYTGVTVLIYNLFSGERKDRAMGLRGSANSLGGAVWPVVGGALGTLSWHAPFAVYGLALPLGVLASLTVPETALNREISAETGDDGGIAGLLSVFAARPVILLVYGLYFVANLLLYAYTVYYPALLATFGVESSLVISLYLAALGVVGGTSAYFYDRIKRRFGYRQLTLAALALWTVGFAVAAVADGRFVAVLPVALFGLGQGLVFPTVLLWIEELAPADRKGQYSSYVAMFGYIGQFLSPVVLGPVAGAAGVHAVFAVAGTFVGVAVLGVAIAHHRR
ncbi:MFS transporter [Halalkalicoccus jeotgali]|uniref:Major facilitator family multidrug efflux transporter n=1 Tax=Halalkalicoccus jeotgali (strain DSM 18796 / CECT 7217 / JCM 14584 / KCTC 4019 / B3) TaxID=795797 RepID=D8JAS5_HALJB|nr:MFS transporter [Halalkalicoccus jeotgali]ADJ14797.1 major facilitator family multidrug efflux transporter [Halalkalicoccus jeotgali B3]ELY39379.1 major facilitator family multidrug efflux transporter [Halalkalicoccus jeotgali B3]